MGIAAVVAEGPIDDGLAHGQGRLWGGRRRFTNGIGTGARAAQLAGARHPAQTAFCEMASLKNQHFVPRCLLKPFTYRGEGRAISLYNIRGNKLIARAPVRGQCARDYLYGKDGKIETSLARIETSFNSTRQRVMRGSLDDHDLRDLNFFTYLQSRRTEMAAQQIKEVHQNMMSVEGIFGINAPKIPSNHMLVMLSLHLCLRLRRYIEDLKIRVIENQTNVDFVISDDPSVLINRFAAQKLNGASFGVSSAGLIMTMPLSPRFAVICYDGQVYTVPDLMAGRIVLTEEEAVKALNELQFLKAGENIYFSKWEDGDYVKAQFHSVKHARSETSSMLTHLVPDSEGKYQHEGQRYRLGTRDEAKAAGVSLITTSFKYPQPTRWFSPLKFRTTPKFFYAGTGVGHVRKEEWLHGPEQ